MMQRRLLAIMRNFRLYAEVVGILYWVADFFTNLKLKITSHAEEIPIHTSAGRDGLRCGLPVDGEPVLRQVPSGKRAAGTLPCDAGRGVDAGAERGGGGLGDADDGGSHYVRTAGGGGGAAVHSTLEAEPFHRGPQSQGAEAGGRGLDGDGLRGRPGARSGAPAGGGLPCGLGEHAA